MPNLSVKVYLMPFIKGDLLQTVDLVVPDAVAGETLGDVLETIFAIANGQSAQVPWPGRRSMSVGDVLTIGGRPDAWVVLGAGWRSLQPGEIDRLCAMDFSTRLAFLAGVK